MKVTVQTREVLVCVFNPFIEKFLQYHFVILIRIRWPHLCFLFSLAGLMSSRSGLILCLKICLGLEHLVFVASARILENLLMQANHVPL